MKIFAEQRLSYRFIAVALFGGVIITIAILLTLNNVKNNNLETSGFTAASTLASQVASMRSFYTSEILKRAKIAGVRANYDFEKYEDVLPLPATFVHALGAQIEKDYPGTKVRLYSRYPFPHRADAETYDKFEMDALTALEQNSKTPFWRIENVDGRKSIRFAQADVMKAACVGCHNSHPETPKIDWKVGDTRGVVEVVMPVDDIEATIAAGTRNVIFIVLGVITLVALLISYVVKTGVLIPAAKLKAVTQKLADGDLSVKCDYENTYDALGQVGTSITNMTHQFRGIMNEINDTSLHIASTSEELNSVASSTQQQILLQKMETEQMATATNEMACTSIEVANNAAQAAKTASDANQEALNSKLVVSEATQLITDLASEVERVANVIHELQEDSSNIGAVLDVIRGIAEQTNLLALNAAIEAARAGEQGRGFAVVADEVRTLASRTQESTQEIQTMIENLQARAKEAVNAMEQGRNKAKVSVEQTGVIEGALEKIVHHVNETNNMFAQISTAANEQSNVVEETNKNITTISDIAETTNAGSTQISQASNELAEHASKLQSMISQFKT